MTAHSSHGPRTCWSGLDFANQTVRAELAVAKARSQRGSATGWSMRSAARGSNPRVTDAQVARRRHGSTSEYVRELIRRDLDRSNLRDLLLDGAGSEPAVVADHDFFDELRGRARRTSDG